MNFHRQCERKPGGGDQGATLVLVLIIVTVLAAFTGVVLTQVDTGVRISDNLRGQTATAYAADGAAQIALQNLATGGYQVTAGQKCFKTSSTTSSNVLPLSGTFSDGQGGTMSGAVLCDTDMTSGNGGSTNLHAPGTAILTLGKSSDAVNGLDVNVNGASGGTTYVQGRIYSSSYVNVTNNTTLTDTNSTVQYATTYAAKPPCGQGVVVSTGVPPCALNTTTPATDPNYSLPTAGVVANGTIPATCAAGGTLAAFRPGRYTSAAALTSCKATTMEFLPNADGSNGVYYFDFPAGDNVWTVTQVLVGGTPSPSFKPAVRPSADGSCIDPINPAGGVAAPGVEFVFGGSSQFNPSKATGGGSSAAIVEICGSRETTPGTVANQPPIAMFAPKADVKDSTGAVVARAQAVGNPLMTTTVGDKPFVYLRGTVYVPRSKVVLYVANASRQVFNFGVISQALSLSVAPQTSGQQLIYVDNTSDGSTTTPVVALLRVYVCAGASACSTGSSDTPSILVKVSIAYAAGGSASMRVLAWSQPR